ncbi:polygalacturonase inhibitor-like [Salvia miltiorrhiza]|uniref:polygalacturonase inhibitor-like n=1 Tax=Salvia miltiorrhiza TaxID=226208 RepID=UPI0025AC624C|nr:polygalacturonase inhibitor-like [Salvia miltiorrhiza]
MASSHLPLLFLISISFLSVSFTERCHPNDKNTLLQIKKDLNDPYFLISWDPKTDCCDHWYVVKCDDKTNRITEFVLAQTDLHLPIPAAIGDLPYLQDLTIHACNATGKIPQAISKLSQLNFLDLRQNLLTGPVPSFLGNLKKLTYIGLSRNSLTGSIPPSLSQLPELSGLLLDRNNLTGGIPESFADFKQKSFYLYMSHNQLFGPIPRRLGYTNFTFLDVSRNKLEGDVSFMFGKNKSMNTADFSRNLLQFNLSKVEFSENLQNLNLNHNKILGSIPAGLTNINLSSMNVSYNRLCGRIPVGGRLQDFDYTAYFHNRCLCGRPLPECKF